MEREQEGRNSPVLPVPGGPTTRVKPSFIALLMQSTWTGVNGTVFCFLDVLRIGPHIWKGVRYHVDFLFLEFQSIRGKHVRFRFSGGEDDGLPGKRIFEVVEGDEGMSLKEISETGGCVLTFFGISVTQKNVSKPRGDLIWFSFHSFCLFLLLPFFPPFLLSLLILFFPSPLISLSLATLASLP